MMYDKERIGKIISDIERYYNDLESIDIKSLKELEDKRNFYSASMLLFSIINRVIDLGEEVVAANNLGTPSTYKDIFFLLWKGKIIDTKIKTELSELASYRNLFSHEYYNFTEKDVLDGIKRIAITKDFAKGIRSKVRQ